MAGTTREVIDWRTLVAEAEGEEFPFFTHIAYEFSCRFFEESDSDGHYNTNKPN